MSQYIGKTISLISNKSLRYVGLLDKISAEDATVSLKSVRSFGTEGRMAEQGQPSMEVMPGTDIYEYVVFRGSDVKDLSVLDIPIDQVQPVVYYPPSATASAAQETSAQNAAVQTPAPTAAPSAVDSTAAAAASREDYVQHTTRDAVAAQNQSASVSASPAGRETAARETGRVSGPSSTSSSSHVTDAPRATPTTTDGQVASKTSEQAPREHDAPAPAPKQDFNTAFDFEEANSRFEKERPQDAANKPTYDKKSSFFDTISSNEHQQRNNMRWHEEKNLNMDTFGEAYAHRGGRGNYRGNRGGRGRGNGYRGGRGRGNYRGRGSSEPKPEWA